MQPIQYTHRSVVQIELFMVQVMHLGLIAKEIISAMHCRRAEQLIPQEQPKGEDVALQELRR